MEPANKETPIALSVPLNPNPEKETKKELLLNEKYAGLHGALLLNGEMPGAGKTLDTGKLQEVRKKIDAGESFETTKLTNGSKQERDDYWAKKTEFKSFEEQKKAWIESTKKFLDFYNNKPEAEILGRLGMRAGGENEIYDKYFSTVGEGKGDIGYFATTVSTELKRDEIEKYSELIGKIGGFYGENSSVVAKHLAEAVTNVKVNYSDFEKVSAEQFAQGEKMEGIDILKGVHERSGKWEADQKQKEDAKKAAEEKLRQEKAAAEEAERKRKEQEEKKKEAEKKPKIVIATELNKELELAAKLEEGEKEEFENRLIVIPESINKRLEELTNSSDGVEKEGLLIYKKGKEGEKKYLIEEMIVLGEVKDGYEEYYADKTKIINEFSSKNRGEYGIIEFFSHPQNFGEAEPEKFPDLHVDRIKNLASYKEDRHRMYILATPGKRTIAGIGDPNSIIENYEAYTEDNFVSKELKRIEEEVKQKPVDPKQEKEEEMYKTEVPNAVKFIIELKEGKLGLEESLGYFEKLRDLRERNKQNFDSFLYFEMDKEIGKPRPGEAGKGRVNASEKERARIIDSLIEKAKQESGDNGEKQEEYRQKIIKNVFRVFSLRDDDYGYYAREGNKDNVKWLGIESSSEQV